jgi:micrococcal nuclease
MRLKFLKIVLLFLVVMLNAQLKENTFYKVSKISDGDTFYVKTENSEKFKIRLIGIDAPESYNVGKKFRKEYFGKEAKVFVTNLLKNKKVKLTFDVQKTDRYGRILAYLFRKWSFSQSIFSRKWFCCGGYISTKCKICRSFYQS